jgi:hypothetical protein
MQFAYIAQCLGLIEGECPMGLEGEDDEGPERDLYGPAQFIAGWLYGVSG